MGRIPEFTQQIFAERSNPSNIEASFAINGGNQARQLSMDSKQSYQNADAAGRFSDEVTKQLQAQGQIKAQEKFNEFQRTKTPWYQEQKNQRMTTPDGFAKGFDDWHRQTEVEIEDEISQRDSGDPFDMDLFRQLMDRDRTSTFEEATGWENGMRVQNITVSTEKNIDESNSNFALTKPGFKDLPGQFDSLRGYVNTVGSKVLAPEQNFRLAKYGMNNAAGVVMDNVLENDPYAARDVLMYGQGTNDQVIDYVMYEIEGGDAVVDEPNGGVAKFGINSIANGLTKEQVEALTPDEARKIYKEKYFDKRLEKYSPAFKVVAYDALVNHGNDKNTWAMINQAKGDASSLIQIRREYYDSLATMDPDKYAQYQRGWENRLQQVTGYTQNMEGGGQEFLQFAGMLDPQIIARTQSQIPAAIAAKKREEAAITEKKVTAFNTAFKGTYDAMLTNLEPVGIDEVNELKQIAGNTGDPIAIAKAEAMGNVRPFVTTLKAMGEDQLRQTIRALSADNNKAPSEDGRMKIDIAQGVLDKQIAAVKTEGLAYYGRTGQTRMPQPINYGDTGQSQAEMRAREDAAVNIFARTGKLMPVLTPDEVGSLQENFKNMPANIFAQQLAAFDSLDQRSKALLAQSIAEKDPIIGVAISADDVRVRGDILQGTKLEDRVPKADMTAAIYSVLDPMELDPTQKAVAAQAINAHYKTMSEAERDFTDIADGDRVEKSVERIFGKRVELGGNGTVFTFNNPATQEPLDEDQLYNLFHGMTDKDLTKMFGKIPMDVLGGPVTAGDIISDGRILSAGDGLYVVKFDDIGIVPAIDNPNAPLVIDGRKLLAMRDPKVKAATRFKNDNPYRM